MAIVGCGSGDDDDDSSGGDGLQAASTSTAVPTAAQEQVKKGGIYVQGATGPLSGVDPHTSVYNGAGIVPTVYNYLFRSQLTPETANARGITYDLAMSHKLEADQVTYTFKLRDDVKIAPNSYGVPERMLDSEDVVKSFNRVADKATAGSGYSFMSTWVDKYDAPDKTTFRLVTKKPYAFTEAAIGDPLFLTIVPKEWLVHSDLKKDAVGAGPFLTKELTEGQQARVERNPNYYRKDRPYLDGWTYKFFADVATYRTAFQAGQVDWYTPGNNSESNDLKKSEPSIQQFSDPGLGFNSFWMKVNEQPWTDPRVRRAVNLAINRKEFIEIIGRGVGEPIGPLTYAFKEALPKDELERLQPYNPGEAKKLFQEAGITEIAFSHPTSSTMNDYVNIFVRQLQQAGVTAKPEPLDAGTWLASYSQAKLKASFSLNQAYKTPDSALRWFHTGGFTGAGTFYHGWEVPEIDKAIDDAASIMDPAARLKAYQDVQRLVLSKDPPFLNIFGTREELVIKGYVKNYPAGTASLRSAFYDTIWLDKA